MTLRILTGNDAAAYGGMLSRVEIVSGVPITPVSDVCERLSGIIAEKKLKARVINAENEHSVLNILLGACLAGCRTFTATSGNGLGLMSNVVYLIPCFRLPVVMAVGHRPLSPVDFLADHSDVMSTRDSGWIQLYVEDCQEILDTVIQAYKISEDKRVLLPLMICFDGWYLSYLSEPVDVPNQDSVDVFLPPFKPKHLSLDPEKHYFYAAQASAERYNMEFKFQFQKSMNMAKKVISEIGKTFGKNFGREYGLLDEFMSKDSEVILVAMGSITGTARVVVEDERRKGKKVGLVKVRSFRPFPEEEIVRSIQNSKIVVVLDRSISTGAGGPLFESVRSALYNLKDRPVVIQAFAGLGGRDVTEKDIRNLIALSSKISKGGKIPIEPIWVGLNLNSKKV